MPCPKLLESTICQSAVKIPEWKHALIPKTLAKEPSITRRERLHARIAEGLEELYGIDAEAHGAELARRVETELFFVLFAVFFGDKAEPPTRLRLP